MAIPTAHLAMTGIGVASAGGLICGGYFVFKDNPKPVTELLKKQNRRFLNKNEDKDGWSANWKKYIDDNSTTKVTEELAPVPPATSGAGARSTSRTTRKTEKIVNEKDLWNLKDWGSKKVNGDNILESFKDKCEEFRTRSISGTWTTEYQNIVKYCTKAIPVGETESD